MPWLKTQTAALGRITRLPSYEQQHDRRFPPRRSVRIRQMLQDKIHRFENDGTSTIVQTVVDDEGEAARQRRKKAGHSHTPAEIVCRVALSHVGSVA